MYYVPNTYFYPYYANVNTPMYHSDYMSRNHQQVFEAILAGIKRETSGMDLYSRLANVAPNQKHKNNILHALEYKKVHLNQFTNLYITLTGRQPMYQIDKVTFHSYGEGLKKAHEAGVEGYEEYRKNCLLTQYPLVQNVFLHVSTGEKENATRLGSLNEEVLKDYGSKPFVVNIEEVTEQNNTYRTALWTGSNFQVTVMSINVGDDIGLEVHPTTDQFIRIEEGQGLVQMGDSKDKLTFEEKAYDDYAIMIPAGKWHNLTNTGNKPLKIYVIYAPPEHPYGTVHETKAIAMASKENH
ncbi:Mannose-6-phosphate isomerase, cupin superfamily [Paenibacillus uliginis N3/975]|uniref:Mannose-6-phosphate isomerase, cupin superfamily n=1 Tax=Paenibacillus uliginis N3/975 TaxID=1313296 RepID=A0A1X7HFQ2_9BACL|nr:cupin domain-containing protein [Paenibacillus uliginis]SMF84761.1 Mannose-6-phosphate isomerase, cupin superfamily [Paenibacillus uliginis N3/975]